MMSIKSLAIFILINRVITTDWYAAVAASRSWSPDDHFREVQAFWTDRSWVAYVPMNRHCRPSVHQHLAQQAT